MSPSAKAITEQEAQSFSATAATHQQNDIAIGSFVILSTILLILGAIARKYHCQAAVKRQRAMLEKLWQYSPSEHYFD